MAVMAVLFDKALCGSAARRGLPSIVGIRRCWWPGEKLLEHRPYGVA
jgi:hypothetical protein